MRYHFTGKRLQRFLLDNKNVPGPLLKHHEKFRMFVTKSQALLPWKILTQKLCFARMCSWCGDFLATKALGTNFIQIETFWPSSTSGHKKITFYQETFTEKYCWRTTRYIKALYEWKFGKKKIATNFGPPLANDFEDMLKCSVLFFWHPRKTQDLNTTNRQLNP